MNANSTVPGAGAAGAAAAAAPAKTIAVFTAGRFQPPTPGHLALLEKVVEEAEKRGGEAFVFPSYSVKGYGGENIPKNPLSYESKIFNLERLINNSPLKGRIILVRKEACEKPCNQAFGAAAYLKQQGYTKLFLVLGSDREDPKFHSIKNTTVIYVERNVKSNDPIIGMSGTKIRTAALAGNKNTIAKAYNKYLTTEEQEILIGNIQRGTPPPKGGYRKTRRARKTQRKTRKYTKA